MNDIRVRKIPIMLDKPRNLVVDFNTFVELEEIYGSHKAAIDALKSGSFKAIRTFVWLCLLHEDKTLTEKQVGQLINVVNVEKIANEIYAAITTDQMTNVTDKILNAVHESLPDEKK